MLLVFMVVIGGFQFGWYLSVYRVNAKTKSETCKELIEKSGILRGTGPCNASLTPKYSAQVTSNSAAL